MTGKPEDEEKLAGYKRTPEHTKYRKGQSGNPGGRPRSEKLDLDRMIIATLESKVPNSNHTVLDIMLNGLVRRAAQGDIKSNKFLLERYYDASRKRETSNANDEADLQAGKRILRLDPRYFADLINEPQMAEGRVSKEKDDDRG